MTRHTVERYIDLKPTCLFFKKGAAFIAQEVEQTYGPDSLAFLVDEGFGGVDEAYGATFASLGMAEKGTTTVTIKVQ